MTSVAANLQSQTFRSFEIYIVVTAIYLALALSFSALFKLIYQRVLTTPTADKETDHAYLGFSEFFSSCRPRSGRWRCRPLPLWAVRCWGWWWRCR